MYKPLTKPQEISAVLDNGTRLLMAGIKPAAIILLLMIAVEIALMALFGHDMASTLSRMEKGQINNIHPGDLLSFILPSMLVYLLFTNAMIAVYSAIINARQISLREAFSIAVQKLLPVLGYRLLYNLILTITFLPAFVLLMMSKSLGILAVLLAILAIILPIILSISLYFSDYLIITEDIGIFAALARSRNLVKGNVVRTGIYLALIAVIQLISVLMIPFILIPVVIALIIPYLHDLKLRQEDGSSLAA